MAQDYSLEATKTVQAGTCYFLAGVGITVKNQGDRKVCTHVHKVWRPSLVVSETTDTNYDVHFSTERSYELPKKIDSITEIKRKHEIFVSEAKVQPHQKGNGGGHAGR